MIFATVGSHPTYSFERFLRALETLPDGEVVVQHGPGQPPANARHAVAWMTFGEIVEQMESADHVVSHAGVGTILCAVRAGQTPVVFPRLKRFEETVDDHQLELGRRLAEDGRLILIEDETKLAVAVAAAPPRGAQAGLDGSELIAAVRAELIA